ncbi:hypothetical protein CPC16_007769 [Podila verticillata]|nr:hypothetical protein CPC16_007769 [Podila verticillata]
MTWSTTLQDHLKDRLPQHKGSPEETQNLLSPQQYHPRRPCPTLHCITERHLQEFCTSRPHSTSSSAASTSSSDSSTPTHTPTNATLKEPLSVKPMQLRDFVKDSVFTAAHSLRHPSEIPGKSIWSKAYALGMFPTLIAILVFCKWTIGIVLLWTSQTRLGKYAWSLFLKDQILLYDETDSIDPKGTDEALRQLTDREHKPIPKFSYHLANLLLVLSTMTYERDDNKVKEAAKILEDIENQSQRDKAARLLQESEEVIDSKAQLFGMRFRGVSELKTLGGPFAGLFYNDETIVLVFKGTSVLAFNEYVLDAFIQRVDASEYLYGEVHRGFYESLFPDPAPHASFEQRPYDATNPFNTIMETIFETAIESRSRTGKPVQLWITGHSLGGALAAMTMARLQLCLSKDDPLFHRENPTKQYKWNEHKDSTRTVLDEMLTRFNTKYHLASPPQQRQQQHHSHLNSLLDSMHIPHFQSSYSSSSSSSWDSDLIVLRDVYSFASPKMCNSDFAQQFDRNQVRYVAASPFRPVYYRVIVDKDVIPRMPPTCSTDQDDECELMFPCPNCPQHRRRDNSNNEHARPGMQSSVDSNQTLYVHMHGGDSHDSHKHPTPLGSLLDYCHIGQLVSVYNTALPPLVKPSEFQTDLTGGTLRNNCEMLEFLSKLEMTLEEAQTQPEYNSDDDDFSMGYRTFKSQSFAKSPPSPATKKRESPPVNIHKIMDEISQAHARHEIDTLQRMRVPCDAERFLLTFPNVISHSPATYQRNLARARFFFASFPGPEFEERYAAVLVREREQREMRMERRQGSSKTRTVQATTTTREVLVQMDRPQEVAVAV